MCVVCALKFRDACFVVLFLLPRQADHVEIYFHSDSSNNDWGVRLYAYGIMQVKCGIFSAGNLNSTTYCR